jgi:dTDP-4-amino-4,6-dideoxygalactose transaminase
MFPAVSRRVIQTYPGEGADIIRLFWKRGFVRGDFVGEFEEKFARYVGVPHAVAVASGRAALLGIFKALGLPSGSEVVLPAYEDMSVPGAVREAGLIPVFADIDPLTLNTDPSRLAEKLTDRTSAVIVAHLFGVPVDTAKVRSSIGGRNILFIEDCAHAVGSRIEGRHVGHEGDLAFFSFNTTKPFNCFGGGMIVTRDAKIHRVLRGFFDGSSSPGSVGVLRKILRGYLLRGLTFDPLFSFFVFPLLRLFTRYNVELLVLYKRMFQRSVPRISFSKLSNVQALIGIRNLEGLEKVLKTRRGHARKLDGLLGKDVRRPETREGCNRYFYVVLSRERDAFRRRLLGEGLDTGKHLMRNGPALLGQEERFLNTEAAIASSVQIPLHERLSSGQVDAIARIILKHYVC